MKQKLLSKILAATLVAQSIFSLWGAMPVAAAGEEIPIDEAIISSADFYLSNYPLDSYKISDIELCDSVKENCEKFNGKYVDRNGYACIFGKQVGKKNNIVILYGDIFAIDQDKLYRIKIYVE